MAAVACHNPCVLKRGGKSCLLDNIIISHVGDTCRYKEH